MRKTMAIVLLSLILSGCGGSSSGVITEPPTTGPATPTPIPTATPVQSTEFSQANSSINFYKNDNIVSSSGVNDSLKIRLAARDVNGNLKPGLNVSFTVNIENGISLSATEESPGIYAANFEPVTQGTFEAKAVVQTLTTQLTKSVDVSLCNNPFDAAAAPFHRFFIANNTTYKVICTEAQLALLAQPANLSQKFTLGKTLDLTTYYTTNAQFKIGTSATPFTGELSGFNFLIKNFKYQANEDDVGFFGVIGSGAIVSNVQFDNAQIRGQNNVGLAGRILTSQNPVELSNIVLSETSSIVASGSFWGGVVGNAMAISPAFIIIDQPSIIITQNLNAAIQNQSYIGGIVGFGQNVRINDGFVNSNFTSTTSNFSASFVGSIIGSGQFSEISEIAITSYQEYNKGNHIGGLAGRLNQVDVSEIQSSLFFMSQLNSTALTETGGAVGEAVDSTFTNINAYVLASSVNGSFGGLVGIDDSSLLNNIFLGGSISVVQGNFIGSIIGDGDSSSLIKATSYVSISGQDPISAAGGLAGRLSNGQISRSSNFGTVSLPNSPFVGGLVGVLSQSNITNSLNQGAISGRVVGGIMGSATGLILDSAYSSGNLTSSLHAGGLIGTLSNSSISDSFSESLINTSSAEPSGAIAGTVTGSNDLVNNYYRLAQNPSLGVCGSTACPATDTSSSGGKEYYYNSSNAPLNNWDFTLIWGASVDNYPYLK